MKKTMILAFVIVFAFGMIIVGGSDAKVEDTFHDFSLDSNAWSLYNGATDILGASTSQMCVFCHHPHRSTGSGLFTNEVLWNQTDNGGTYAVYDSDTINGTALTISSSSGLRSYLCLSCHDGDIAKNALVALPGDGTNITNALALDSYANLGSTLEDDHPVNITVATTDTGLASASAIMGDDLPLYGAADNTIQCATCHDVHDSANTESTGIQFMRITGWELNSAICVICHTNK